MRKSFYIVVFVLFALFLWVQLEDVWLRQQSVAGSLPAHQVRTEYTQPHPSLSPQEVVEIQILALQANDHPSPNYGIKKVYNFSSPDNKAALGPVDNYIDMLHNPVYRPLINLKIYGLDDVRIMQDVAIQKVTMIDAEDEPAVFVFQLSLQQDEPFDDCWMIDKVMKY